MQAIFIGLLGAIVSLGGFFGYDAYQEEQTLGAFGDPFLSIQLATNPSNGECLTTDGTNNEWVTCASGGGGGGGGFWSTTTNNLIIYPTSDTYTVSIGDDATSTAEFYFDPNTSTAVFGKGGVGDSKITYGSSTQWTAGLASTSLNYILAPNSALTGSNLFTFNRLGNFNFPYGSTTALSASTLCLSTDCRTSWPTGGSGGSGSISTSSPGVVGSLLYYTTAGATPELVAPVATGTLSASTPLSLSGSTVIIGPPRTLTLDTSGAWSGNAGTASALAANGSNCSAGQAAGGVTAAGAAEDCTDYWTEAENTSAAYLNLTSLSAISKGFFFSTTSANYYTSVGLSWSTTSADAWEAIQTARTADDLTNNSIEDLSDVSPITENYGDLLGWNGSAWIDFATSSLAFSWNDLADIPAGFADGTDDGGGGGLSSYDAWTHPAAGQSATTSLLMLSAASSTRLSVFQEAKFGASATSSFNSAGVLSLATPLSTANGGTGISNPGTLAIGSLLQFNGSGGASAIAAGADGSILKVTADTWVGGSLNLADADAVGTSILSIANGGTGWANIQTNAIPYGNGTTRLSTTTQGTAGQVLGLVGGVPTWVSTSTAPTVTAGDGLTLTGNDIDCDTASSSILGCLSSTDWSLFNNKVSTTSIDTITEVETLWGVSNILIENDIDASSELMAIMDDETGTSGGLVFAGSPTITSPTLTSFFGTQCTGNEFLQDIGDTGAFTCAAASGGGGGNMSGWATTTPYGSQLLLYPVNATATDVIFGGNASTSSAPFWWDVSATTTYIGNGGTGSSTIQVGPSGFEWLFGYDGSDNKFKFSSSTANLGLSVNTAFDIAKTTLLTTFRAAVTVVGNLTLSANLIFDGETFDSLTDDATLANNAGDLQVVDLTCTDCINDTEISTNAGTALSADLEEEVTTGSLADGVINEPDLDVDDAPNDGEVLTYDTTGTNFVWETILALVNTITGAVDWGGITSFEIPNGTAPVVDAVGEIALDTTANQLLIGTTTNASFPATLPLEQPLFSVTIGSTTPEFVGSNGTVPISRWVGKAREITRAECFVQGGTSKVINVTDGTNDTETITCGTTNTQDNSMDTNTSFTASELWYLEFGATSGAVNYVTYTAYGYVSRE